MPRRPKDRSEYEGYDPIVTSPEPIERSEEEGYDPIVTMPRQDYKGFQMPSGMSLPQRRKWKRSIDVRESGAGERQEARDDADTEALKQGIIDRTKDVGGFIKGAVEDVVLAGPRAKAAAYSDPEGAKEFGRAVVSGDRPAIRTLSEEVSKSAVEPFATGAEAVLGGLAAEEGKYGEAAMYGGMLLLPGVLSKLGPKMSKGWLKSAAEAGEELPDEAAKKMNDLAKRVDEGKVTDDMQIRREIAMIEDAHASDYQASLADVESDFDFESVSGKPPGGGRSVDAEKMLSGQLEQINKDLDYEYNQLELNTDPESVRQAELNILDLLTKKRQLVDFETRSGRIDKRDIDRFSGELSRSQFKPQDFPDVDLNPDQEDLLNTISELGEKTVGANKYRVTGRFPENPDLIDWFQTKLSLLRGRPSEPGIDRSEYLNALVDTYADIGKNYDDFFRVSGFQDDLSSSKLNDRLSQNYAARIDSGRRIDDLEGPSEAEIRQMVDQRFADPNELEMMKEDMRRMAELTQDEQIAQAKKGRTRRSRTPGAPGATEGSVKRERPMPKAKKGKYEN